MPHGEELEKLWNYPLQHEFIKNAKPVAVLQKMILEAREIQEEQTLNTVNGDDSVSLTRAWVFFSFLLNKTQYNVVNTLSVNKLCLSYHISSFTMYGWILK